MSFCSKRLRRSSTKFSVLYVILSFCKIWNFTLQMTCLLSWHPKISQRVIEKAICWLQNLLKEGMCKGRLVISRKSLVNIFMFISFFHITFLVVISPKQIYLIHKWSSSSLFCLEHLHNSGVDLIVIQATFHWSRYFQIGHNTIF